MWKIIKFTSGIKDTRRESHYILLKMANHFIGVGALILKVVRWSYSSEKACIIYSQFT